MRDVLDLPAGLTDNERDLLLELHRSIATPPVAELTGGSDLTGALEEFTDVREYHGWQYRATSRSYGQSTPYEWRSANPASVTKGYLTRSGTVVVSEVAYGVTREQVDKLRVLIADGARELLDPAWFDAADLWAARFELAFTARDLARHITDFAQAVARVHDAERNLVAAGHKDPDVRLTAAGLLKHGFTGTGTELVQLARAVTRPTSSRQSDIPAG